MRSLDYNVWYTMNRLDTHMTTSDRHDVIYEKNYSSFRFSDGHK